MGWSGLVHGIKHTQGEWRTKYAINTNKLYSPRSISQDSGQCVGVFFVLINSKGKITITHPQSCPHPFVTGRLLFGLVGYSGVVVAFFGLWQPRSSRGGKCTFTGEE